MKKIVFLLMLEYIAFQTFLFLDADSFIYYISGFWTFLNLLIIPSLLIRNFWARSMYICLWYILFLLQLLLFIVHAFFPTREIPAELFLLVSRGSIPALFQYHFRMLLFIVVLFGLPILIYLYVRKRGQHTLFFPKILFFFSLFNIIVLVYINFVYSGKAIKGVIQRFEIIAPVNVSEYDEYGAHFPFSNNIENVEATANHNLIHIILESTEKNFLDEELFPNLCPQLKKYFNKGIVVENMDMPYNAQLTFGGMYASFTGKWLSIYSHENDIFLKSEANSISFPQILRKAGYNQVFIYGHKNAFIGFQEYLDRQGFSSIRVEGIHQSYTADEEVFKRALKEFRELSRLGKPFNLTLLTVNAHAPDGMILEDMNLKYYSTSNPLFKSDLLDVIHTTDAALGNFLEEVSKDPNFKNTTVVIQSDHLAHPYTNRTVLNQLSKKPRKMLFVILNSTKEKILHHDSMTFDIAPTVLSAMGVNHNARFLFGENLFDSTVNSKRLVYSNKQERINSYYYNAPEIKSVTLTDSNNKSYLKINEDIVPILNLETQLPYKHEEEEICILKISKFNTYTGSMTCDKECGILEQDSSYILYGISGDKKQILCGVEIPPHSKYLIFKKNTEDVIYDIVPPNNIPYIEL